MIVSPWCSHMAHIEVTSPLIYHQELDLILLLISESTQFKKNKDKALSTTVLKIYATQNTCFVYIFFRTVVLHWPRKLAMGTIPSFLLMFTGDHVIKDLCVDCVLYWGSYPHTFFLTQWYAALMRVREKKHVCDIQLTVLFSCL